MARAQVYHYEFCCNWIFDFPDAQIQLCELESVSAEPPKFHGNNLPVTSRPRNKRPTLVAAVQ
jgi:hypothetical protein